jgi:general secretion pathway protein I
MQKGFSLLEVLVAFVILALVATALFRLFGGALGNAGVAEDASRAVLVAQSRLDATRGEMRGAATSGVEQDKYAWTTRIEPWESPDAVGATRRRADADADAALPDHRRGQVPGAGGRERALALSSLKLARREGAP